MRAVIRIALRVFVYDRRILSLGVWLVLKQVKSVSWLISSSNP